MVHTGAMEAAQISISFQGPATEEHWIDVRQLAPSMLALADGVDRAQQIVAPSLDVHLNVRATEPGSFVICFEISGVLRDLMDLLTSQGATAAAQAVTIAGCVVGAIKIGVAKARHRGRPKADTRQDGKTITLCFPDGTTMEVASEDWEVFQDHTAMSSLAKALSPLDGEGLDQVTVSHKHETVTIQASDMRGFSPDDAEDSALRETVTRGAILQLADVSFRERGKWRLNDGAFTFTANVEDEDFLARVDSGEERFGKADLLVADLRVIPRLDPQGKLRSDRVVQKVLEHRTPDDPPLLSGL